AAVDGVIDSSEERWIRQMMEAGNLTAVQRAEAALEAFRARYRAAISDNEVTNDEYDELINLQTALNIRATDISDEMMTIQRLRQLAAIERGELPVWSAPSIILKKGEINHMEATAGVVEERTFRERIGKN